MSYFTSESPCRFQKILHQMHRGKRKKKEQNELRCHPGATASSNPFGPLTESYQRKTEKKKTCRDTDGPMSKMFIWTFECVSQRVIGHERAKKKRTKQTSRRTGHRLYFVALTETTQQAATASPKTGARAELSGVSRWGECLEQIQVLLQHIVRVIKQVDRGFASA